MNNQKVLITGASGFIGVPLVKRLERIGCNVLAISRTRPSGEAATAVTWLKADLSSPETYRQEIESFGPEVVIHLAWQDIPDFSFEKSMLNLSQSLRFLSFVLDLGTCKKILISGSCLEFNKAQGECLESDIGLPTDHFTWAKHSIRSWLEMECSQQEVILAWFRVFYVYGPRQRPESLIPTILRSLKNNELPPLRTLNDANDYIFIDDVVDAFYLVTIKNKSSGLYNLGTGISTTVFDVCRCSEKIVHGSEYLSQQLENEFRNGHPNLNFWAEIKETKECLGWAPQTKLEDGIKATWNFLKQND